MKVTLRGLECSKGLWYEGAHGIVRFASRNLTGFAHVVYEKLTLNIKAHRDTWVGSVGSASDSKEYKYRLRS